MRAPGRPCGRAVMAAAALAGLVAVIAAAAPAGAQAEPDDARLLERFSPVVVMRQQLEECGEGERYLPVPVETVLGRDDVVLRDESDVVVTAAPVTGDLAAGDEDLWIDLPGDVFHPGCEYERWFRGLGATPAMYGRVTSDGGQLVLQYWFFWIYNQWNDLHEGDWEMVQLIFESGDEAEAMHAARSTYAYAQHEGLEVSSATGGKVALVDGTHPTVFAAEGSHASFFSSSRWFSNRGDTGFGCDDTSGPIEQIRPNLITLPREAPTEGEFAWLSFRGHWGQKAPSFDNGPTGPAMKTQWSSPVGWVKAEGRDTAVKLPFTSSPATDMFCGLATTASSIFNEALDDPGSVLLVLGVVVLLVAAIVRASSRGLLRRAARTWRGHRRSLAPIGVVVLLA